MDNSALWAIAHAFERIAKTLEQQTATVERQAIEKSSAATVAEIERRSVVNSLKNIQATTKPVEFVEPTDIELFTACFRYRRDYSLLSLEQQCDMRQVAKDWLKAWQHVLRQQ